MNIQLILYKGISLFFDFLTNALLIRLILSWFVGQSNPIMKFLDIITEPILSPIRNIMYKSPLGGPGLGLDFSYIIAYIILGISENVLHSLVATFL